MKKVYEELAIVEGDSEHIIKLKTSLINIAELIDESIKHMIDKPKGISTVKDLAISSIMKVFNLSSVILKD